MSIQTRPFRMVAIAMAVIMAAAVSACARKPHPVPRAEYQRPVTDADFYAAAPSIVYFADNSAQLDGRARDTLSAQAAWLRPNTQFAITIEGHAAERGTREFNLGLGARRAAAVKGYLVSQGIPAARIRTISYGKERPVTNCGVPSCGAQNRRAETHIALRGAAS